MTLRHLRIFVAVCETNSITAAGEKLFIAQPSVSLAIKELETHYGVKLFDRISKRLHLTAVGKQFLQYATHIVSLFEEIETNLKNWDSIGKLRIGTSITIGNDLLPDLILALQAQYPDLTIEALVDNSKNIEAALLANQIDIGLIEGTCEHPYLYQEAFLQDELVFICHPTHPFANQDIDISMLHQQPFLLREKGSAGRELLECLLTTHQLTISTRFQSISTHALVKGVEANLGLSLLPYRLVEDALLDNRISSFNVKHVNLQRQFYLLYHQNKYLSPSVLALIDHIRLLSSH